MNEEKQAHDTILAWCRADTTTGTLVMRAGITEPILSSMKPQKACTVQNLSSRGHEPAFQADTWVGVLSQIQEAGNL